MPCRSAEYPVLDPEPRAMVKPPASSSMTEPQRAALARLNAHAQGDNGQSRLVADFLLAWWNAEACGGFDLTKLWAVDDAIAADMVTVFALVTNTASSPDTLGFGPAFEAVERAWRPPQRD